MNLNNNSYFIFTCRGGVHVGGARELAASGSLGLHRRPEGASGGRYAHMPRIDDASYITCVAHAGVVSDAPLTHRHIFFGHCFKKQTGWKELLHRFTSGNGTLLVRRLTRASLWSAIRTHGTRADAGSRVPRERSGTKGGCLRSCCWSGRLRCGPVRCDLC